jgi:hypothetical protein
MKPVRPWPANTACPLEGFEELKKLLNDASYHNAAPGTGEMGLAREATRKAAELAIEKEWPLWVIQRMFGEIKPLVEYNGFLQTYVNILFERSKVSA